MLLTGAGLALVVALSGCSADIRHDGGERSASPVASPTATIAALPIVTPTVVVPGASPPPGSTAQPTPPAENPATYIVTADDTLYAIALRFNVSLESLIELNGLTDPNDIQVGQELKIPPRGQ
jgi:LysM repeat protein